MLARVLPKLGEKWHDTVFQKKHDSWTRQGRSAKTNIAVGDESARNPRITARTNQPRSGSTRLRARAFVAPLRGANRALDPWVPLRSTHGYYCADAPRPSVRSFMKDGMSAFAAAAARTRNEHSHASHFSPSADGHPRHFPKGPTPYEGLFNHMHPRLKISAPLLLVTFCARVNGAELPPPAQRTVDFARDVRPILQEHCIGCHGPEKQKSGYHLDTRDAAVKGGDSGDAAILPGKSAESPLIQFVAGLDADKLMPPKKSDKPRLTAGEIGILRAWIDHGAVWPEDAPLARNDPLDWWSLKAIQRPAIPEIQNPKSKIQNPKSNRRLHPRKARRKESHTIPRSRSPHALPPPLFRPHRPPAHARGSGAVRARFFRSSGGG